MLLCKGGDSPGSGVVTKILSSSNGITNSYPGTLVHPTAIILGKLFRLFHDSEADNDCRSETPMLPVSMLCESRSVEAKNVIDLKSLKTKIHKFYLLLMDRSSTKVAEVEREREEAMFSNLRCDISCSRSPPLKTATILGRGDSLSSYILPEFLCIHGRLGALKLLFLFQLLCTNIGVPCSPLGKL